MYGTSPGAGSAGVHTILPGDSVYTISKAYNLPIRDIVEFNSISAPYTLTTGHQSSREVMTNGMGASLFNGFDKSNRLCSCAFFSAGFCREGT